MSRHVPAAWCDDHHGMHRHYLHAVRDYDEYIKYAIDPEQPSRWFLMFTNMKGTHDEYVFTDSNGKEQTGEYIVEMQATNEFPVKPPHFYVLTPNGVYDVDTKVCIEIGVYHPEKYMATLGMRGFAEQVMSGWVGYNRKDFTGISILHQTVEEKRTYARQSREYNRKKLGWILDLIEESYNDYSQEWARKKALEEKKKLPDAILKKLAEIELSDDLPI